MSKYRDDTNEIAVASDSTWLSLSGIIEETARIADVVLVGLMLLTVETAIASDEVIETSGALIVEHATASDAYTDFLRAHDLIVETGTISEQFLNLFSEQIDETATASDAEVASAFAVTDETAAIAEEIIAIKRATVTTEDTLTVSDFTMQAATQRVDESVVAADVVLDKLHAVVLVSDTLTIADEMGDGALATGAAAVEVARISDGVIDRLRAKDLEQESALVQDVVIALDAVPGMAWTANTETWAMSRYAPYGFTSVAVIGGKLFATGPDGVYALSGGTEQIAASIRTAKVDVGKGALAHPLNAYLEYELVGTATMSVSQTQAGKVERYSYVLPPKPAQELTNGRFTFGRGLRGRHFTFELTMTGKRGYINDLSVLVAPTKRRV